LVCPSYSSSKKVYAHLFHYGEHINNFQGNMISFGHGKRHGILLSRNRTSGCRGFGWPNFLMKLAFHQDFCYHFACEKNWLRDEDRFIPSSLSNETNSQCNLLTILILLTENGKPKTVLESSLWHFHPTNTRRLKDGTMVSLEHDGFDLVGGGGLRQGQFPGGPGPNHGGG
jgi:hypothetical protein